MWDKTVGIEAIDVESADGQNRTGARFSLNHRNYASSQVEIFDCDRTHTYKHLSQRVSQGFIYHLEPVILATVVQ